MADDITEFDKQVYNTHLRVFRRGKPFQPRKDFSKFSEEHPNTFINLKKTSKVLSALPAINIKLFFEAPYHVFPKGEEFHLDFYGSMKALSCYRSYIKLLNDSDPDSIEQMYFAKESILYIHQFCSENNLTLKQYLTLQPKVLYYWVIHLVEMRISIYTLLAFNQMGYSVYSLLGNMPIEEQESLIGGYIKNYMAYKTKFDNSKKAKDFIVTGLKKIDSMLK